MWEAHSKGNSGVAHPSHALTSTALTEATIFPLPRARFDIQGFHELGNGGIWIEHKTDARL